MARWLLRSERCRLFLSEPVMNPSTVRGYSVQLRESTFLQTKCRFLHWKLVSTNDATGFASCARNFSVDSSRCGENGPEGSGLSFVNCGTVKDLESVRRNLRLERQTQCYEARSGPATISCTASLGQNNPRRTSNGVSRSKVTFLHHTSDDQP